MKGKLIVLEGTDGAGKATQARLMAQHLERAGVSFRQVNFPRYGSPFAAPVERYLQGDLGKKPGDVSAYAASTLYAVDRYASYRQDWQGERRAYLEWLFDLEYRRLALPEPDLVIYLDLPAELSEQMLRRRQEATHTQADIHEMDGDYLRACRESTREIADKLGWRRVDCSRDGTVRSPEDIHGELWELVRPLVV